MRDTFSFQMSVALKRVEWQNTYPMDFYANDSLGPWTVNNEKHRPIRGKQRNPRTKPGSKDTSVVLPVKQTCAESHTTSDRAECCKRAEEPRDLRSDCCHGDSGRCHSNNATHQHCTSQNIPEEKSGK